MTTTTFQHGTAEQFNARLHETLDQASEAFRRPPYLTFSLTSLRNTHSFRVFVVTAKGDIECVDMWMRNHRNAYPTNGSATTIWSHGRGFALSPGAMSAMEAVNAAAGAISYALRRSFGDAYAATVEIREVR